MTPDECPMCGWVLGTNPDNCGECSANGYVAEPVSRVLWVPLEQVVANDYNPNRVAPNELRLLYHSILHDGYTQPIVTVHNADRDLYEIVDGFHRWLVMQRFENIRARTGGRLPIVVLDKDPAERMASTVRHNRARGKHSVDGMSQIVFKMLDEGLTDETICAELGLEVDELLRLKHITGFARLFEDAEYSRAWETRRMIQLRRDYQEEQVGAEV